MKNHNNYNLDFDNNIINISRKWGKGGYNRRYR